MVSKYSRVLCVMVALFCEAMMISSPEAAGPWAKKKGSGELISTLSLYETSRNFNASSHLVSSNRFYEYQFSPYLEFGLTDKIIVGGQLYLDYLVSKESGKTLTEAGLNDSELFVMYEVWKDDNQVFSVQGGGKIPGPYKKNHNPSLGLRETNLEPRLLYGYGQDEVSYPWYFVLEGAYTFRLHGLADQIQADLTLGVKLAEKWELLLQSYNSISMRNQGHVTVVNNDPFTGVDFDSYEISPSILMRITPTMRLQFGGSFVYAGRKIGQGNTGLVGLWVEF